MASVTNNPLSVHLSPGPPPQLWDPLHILNLSSWYSPQADSSCSLSRLTNSSSILSLLGQNLGATLDSFLILAPQILFIHKSYWRVWPHHLFPLPPPGSRRPYPLDETLEKPQHWTLSCCPCHCPPSRFQCVRTATWAILRLHEIFSHKL